MARRFFTADWHLGSENVRTIYSRPFQSVDRMNHILIDACNKVAGQDDIVIHAGDLCCYGSDRGEINGSKINPSSFINQIDSTFVNIKGNHDDNNKVKSIGSALRTNLGKVFTDVVVCHYPSYDERSYNFYKEGDIIICGHVHNKWKHFIDYEHKVLNINVGVDVWNFKPVSEERLIEYVKEIMNKT